VLMCLQVRQATCCSGAHWVARCAPRVQLSFTKCKQADTLGSIGTWWQLVAWRAGSIVLRMKLSRSQLSRSLHTAAASRSLAEVTLALNLAAACPVWAKGSMRRFKPRLPPVVAITQLLSERRLSTDQVSMLG
jgi:hypothetical protein